VPKLPPFSPTDRLGQPAYEILAQNVCRF